MIRRFGHRALFIWLFGGINICVAVTLIFMAPAPIPDLVHTHLPQWIRAMLWGVTGVTAAILARVNELRLQWLGFLILGLPPSERLASFGISVIINLLDYGPLFWSRLAAFFSYVLWIGALWLASTVIDAVDLDALASRVVAPKIVKGA